VELPSQKELQKYLHKKSKKVSGSDSGIC